jgi:hypothetical protein
MRRRTHYFESVLRTDGKRISRTGRLVHEGAGIFKGLGTKMERGLLPVLSSDVK